VSIWKISALLFQNWGRSLRWRTNRWCAPSLYLPVRSKIYHRKNSNFSTQSLFSLLEDGAKNDTKCEKKVFLGRWIWSGHFLASWVESGQASHGQENFPQKRKFFLLHYYCWVKKISLSRSQISLVRAGSALYLLRVRCILGSGHSPSQMGI